MDGWSDKGTLSWIATGKRFGFEEMVFWSGKGRESFATARDRFDLVITGPHASAGFPAELADFVPIEFTCRKQFDYSDLSMAPLARAWAEIDPSVLYIENPMSRLVLDPNRKPPDDIEPGLRDCFARLARAGQAGAASLPNLAGVDTVRPVTFAGEAVLREPANEAEWRHLLDALRDAGERGPRAYMRLRDEEIAGLLERRRALTASGKPVAEILPLHVMSLHDTMNAKCRSDGAIVLGRPPAERLPAIASLSNRGDEQGEPVGNEPVTIAGSELRCIRDAWIKAFGLTPETIEASLGINRVYKGAQETIATGALLRSVRVDQVGAYQVEFLRETLLGTANTEILRQPGTEWPSTDASHVRTLARCLQKAYDILRRRWVF